MSEHRFKIRALNSSLNDTYYSSIEALKIALSDDSLKAKSISIEYKSKYGLKGVEFISISCQGIVTETYKTETLYSFEKLDSLASGYY